MKKITILFLAAIVFAAMFGTTGCGPEPVTQPTPVDTTSTEDTTDTYKGINTITVGLKPYNLTISAAASYAVYNKAANTTYIVVSGTDKTNGVASFKIEATGDKTGTFTTQSNGGLVFDCSTGLPEDVRFQEYSAANSNFTTTITEYGAVGERIKGTFSGTVKIGASSVEISNGQFDMLRKPNE